MSSGAAKLLFLLFSLVYLLSDTLATSDDEVVVNLKPIDLSQLILQKKNYIAPRAENPTTISTPTTTRTPSFADCGVTNVSGKVYGGIETAPNEFPWQALLLVEKNISGEESSEFCEGTLIGDRWILTSASCMAVQTGQKFIGVYVFLGVEIVQSVNQKTYREYEIYIHPEWNPITQAGNVALIKLSTVVEYTQYIRPICLPSSSEPDYINQQVILTGSISSTSSTNGISGSATAEYRKIITSRISNNQCDAVSNNLMTDRMMCTAGVASSGICKSDKGDPLIFKQTDDTFKQIGIVSFTPIGSGCQTSGTPIAYTRLSSYSNWVTNVMMTPSTQPTSTTQSPPSTPPSTQPTTTQSPSSSATRNGMPFLLELFTFVILAIMAL